MSRQKMCLNEDKAEEKTEENTVWTGICGTYGRYEIVPARRETVQEYFEDCLEAVSADEICETWLLYHASVQDVLKKTLSYVYEGRAEAYFLLLHDPFGGVEVVGMGGVFWLGDISRTAGEIWFAGESLARHKRFLVRYGKSILADILQNCPLLFNIAASWNFETLRLVKFLGFCVQSGYVRAGRDNTLFKRFYITEQMLPAQ